MPADGGVTLLRQRSKLQVVKGRSPRRCWASLAPAAPSALLLGPCCPPAQPGWASVNIPLPLLPGLPLIFSWTSMEITKPGLLSSLPPIPLPAPWIATTRASIKRFKQSQRNHKKRLILAFSIPRQYSLMFYWSCHTWWVPGKWVEEVEILLQKHLPAPFLSPESNTQNILLFS